MDIPADLVPSALGVLLLATITTAVLATFRIPGLADPAIAIGRGAIQLAVISVILGGVITHTGWIAVALVVMFAVACTVATRRIGATWRTLGMMAAAMASGILVTLTVVFASGALELTGRYLLAIGAIIIGNSMSVATLTGRLFTRAVSDHWDEVEGWLAIGATPRRATLDLARRAVRDALVPSIDQTKTTGLVVLPGAFVGAIFGGISPLEAGRFQIVVLAGIMAAGAITACLIIAWMGPVRTKPVPAR